MEEEEEVKEVEVEEEVEEEEMEVEEEEKLEAQLYVSHPGHRSKTLTGFLESSTSRILRFSRGMIPRGSLSWNGYREKGFILHGGNTSFSSLGPS